MKLKRWMKPNVLGWREIEIKAAAIGRVQIKAWRDKRLLRVVVGEEAGVGTWKGMHMAGSKGR